MRAPVCILALILVLPAIVATSDALAKIKPVPRPAKVVSKTAAAGSGSTIAPLAKPAVHARTTATRAKKTLVRRAKPSVRAWRAPARTAVHRRSRPTSTSRVHRVRVLARSRGGRYVPPARSHGGRHGPPALPVVPVVPSPTPLGFVSTGEVLPSYDDPWPSWVFSLLGVMAASEVYLVVHLARRPSFAGEVPTSSPR